MRSMPESLLLFTQLSKDDWANHKAVCRTVAQNEPEQRAKIYFKAQIDQHPEDEMIYYLKTSRPYVNDVTISGPYYPLGMIAPQVLYNLEHSAVGIQVFSDMVNREGDNGLARFGGITTSLDDDAETMMTIMLIESHKPAIASKMPGPSYGLVVQVLTRNPPQEIARFCEMTGYEPLDDVEYHDTFLGEKEAEAAARTLAQRKAKEVGGKEIMMGWRGSGQSRAFVCGISVVDTTGAKPIAIALTVVAKYDGGFVKK